MQQNPSTADVQRAVTGDPAAVEWLLELYLDRLRAFVRLRTGPELREHESASDLVQSVCREMLAQGPRFEYRGEPEFRAWLFTAAANKIRERARSLRAARRDVRREERDGGAVLDAYGAVLPSPSEVAVGRELAARLESAFEQLSPAHRELLTLSRIAGLPTPAIAKHQGRSEGAVRNALARALTQLSGLLDRPDAP